MGLEIHGAKLKNQDIQKNEETPPKKCTVLEQQIFKIRHHGVMNGQLRLQFCGRHAPRAGIKVPPGFLGFHTRLVSAPTRAEKMGEMKIDMTDLLHLFD